MVLTLVLAVSMLTLAGCSIPGEDFSKASGFFVNTQAGPTAFVSTSIDGQTNTENGRDVLLDKEKISGGLKPFIFRYFRENGVDDQWIKVTESVDVVNAESVACPPTLEQELNSAKKRKQAPLTPNEIIEITKTTKDNLIAASRKGVVYHVKQGAKYDSDTEMRVAASFNGGAAVTGVSANSSVNYKYSSKVLLRDSDPEYAVQFSVNIRTLYAIYAHDTLRSTNFVIFYSWVGAPRLVEVYEEIKLSGALAFLNFITLQSSYEQTAKVDYSRRFVLFRYQDVHRLRSLSDIAYGNLMEGKDRVPYRMFEKVDISTVFRGRLGPDDGLAYVTSDDSKYDIVSMPPETIVYMTPLTHKKFCEALLALPKDYSAPQLKQALQGLDGFKFSEAYLRHLQAEGVQIMVPYIQETDPLPSASDKPKK